MTNTTNTTGRTEATDYDVIIAGASIAGCTAAIQFGRAGLRVGLVERSRRMDSYKAMCGHWILGGTQPTLQRLGLWDELLAAGGAPSTARIHTEGAWVHDNAEGVPLAIGLRRQTLDPLLRRIAADTPGVDLHLGCTVTDVIESGGRIAGLAVRSAATSSEITAALTIGADGHHSAVARAAGVPEEYAANERFFYWAYYRNVPVDPSVALVWRQDPDIAVAVPAGEGLTLVGMFLSKQRLDEFFDDRLTAIERAFAGLPDAPSLEHAEVVGRPVGTSDYPLIRRHPAPRAGLALVGDAAMASDPLPAVGCGWAFRSAEWLADAVVAAMTETGGLDDDTLDAALVTYARSHEFARAYDDISRVEAQARPLDPAQRAVRRLAHHDPDVARRLRMFGMRAAPPDVLLNPEVMAKAMAAAG